jgi:hypothetical protein
VSFRSALDHFYPNAVRVEAFAGLTSRQLAPRGFLPGNCLPVVGVCRDELMFNVEQLLHAQWGAAFDMSSLAAMVLLGSSGMHAAAHHAPDDSGRRRYVMILLPHVGIDRDGQVGAVTRGGQRIASPACGALAAIQRELHEGRLEVGLDRHDLELSIVRMELLRRIRYGELLSLIELTEIARQAGIAELERLTAELVSDPDSDVAVISGTVVHGPDGDWVAPAQSWVSIAGGPPHPVVM